MNNELKEILNPAKTVLLIWDIQNRLVQNIFNTQSFLESNKNVISSAKKHNVQVIFSKLLRFLKILNRLSGSIFSRIGLPQ